MVPVLLFSTQNGIQIYGYESAHRICEVQRDDIERITDENGFVTLHLRNKECIGFKRFENLANILGNVYGDFCLTFPLQYPERQRLKLYAQYVELCGIRYNFSDIRLADSCFMVKNTTVGFRNNHNRELFSKLFTILRTKSREIKESLLKSAISFGSKSLSVVPPGGGNGSSCQSRAGADLNEDMLLSHESSSVETVSIDELLRLDWLVQPEQQPP